MPRGSLQCSYAAFFAIAAVACEHDLTVGTWKCGQSDNGSLVDHASRVIPVSTTKIAPTWSSGFEEGFCDWDRTDGWCYGASPASYELVTSPVHSGHFAAGFSIVGPMPSPEDGSQTRCVREGEHPRDAVYGAWYYFPSLPMAVGYWNLMYFWGDDGTQMGKQLWDVSVKRMDDGQLSLFIFDQNPPNPSMTDAPATPTIPIPIGEWFHIELHLRRAADTSGLVELYQNDRKVGEFTDRVTDDTQFGRWYVGNLSTDGMSPPESTLYVDDVTITPAP